MKKIDVISYLNDGLNPLVGQNFCWDGDLSNKKVQMSNKVQKSSSYL